MNLARKLLAAAGGPTRPQYVGSRIEDWPGSVSTNFLDLTGLTGGIGSAPIEGDLVIVFVAYATNSVDLNITCSGGFTEVADLYQADTNAANLGVFYKIMTATPDTSVDVGGVTSDATQAVAAGSIVFRGVDQVTPLDVASVTAVGASSYRADPPSITPVTPGAVIVVAGCNAVSDTEANSIFTASQLNDFRVQFQDDTYDATLGYGRYNWVSGAFNPSAFSTVATAATGSWCAVTMAIRPAS